MARPVGRHKENDGKRQIEKRIRNKAKQMLKLYPTRRWLKHTVVVEDVVVEASEDLILLVSNVEEVVESIEVEEDTEICVVSVNVEVFESCVVVWIR